MQLNEIIPGFILNPTTESKKPLAVIIKGNPKYLNKHKKWANAFYNEVKDILISQGYRVQFDPGKPYTVPTTKADIWIGHSRGCDRLRFAPKDISTLELKTKAYDGDAHGHYVLSKADKKHLSKLTIS
jgi:hypothetical protein